MLHSLITIIWLNCPTATDPSNKHALSLSTTFPFSYFLLSSCVLMFDVSFIKTASCLTCHYFDVKMIRLLLISQVNVLLGSLYCSIVTRSFQNRCSEQKKLLFWLFREFGNQLIVSSEPPVRDILNLILSFVLEFWY